MTQKLIFCRVLFFGHPDAMVKLCAMCEFGCSRFFDLSYPPTRTHFISGLLQVSAQGKVVHKLTEREEYIQNYLKALFGPWVKGNKN